METTERAPLNWGRYALFTVPAIVAAGFFAGRVSNGSSEDIWYATLTKPALTPPDLLFPVMWAIMYVLMAVAAARIMAAAPSDARRNALALFFVQYLLTLGWSPLFFGAHQILGAMVLIVAILITAIAATLAMGRVDRTAGLLMVPYLAWLGFATVLNLRFLQLNA